MVRKRPSSSLGRAGTRSSGSPLSVVGVLVRSFLLLWLSFSINILGVVVYVTVRPWSRAFARRLTGDWLETMWFDASSWLMPPTELIISGDGPADPQRPAVIIANHQVDADWWYSWEFARAYRLHGRLKIILKADLRNIPIMGWGMRQFEFLFLDRKWESDRQRLYSLLGSFVEDKYRAVVLLYPEGTTINTRTLDKCQAFANDRQRPVLQHLLLPRTTGFAACLDALSSAGDTPVIYDLTIAYSGYSGEVPTWEMGYGRERDSDVPSVADLFRGKTCRAVHMHVKTYDGNKAVLADAERFLDDRWREKDALLQRFIDTQSFVAPPPPAPTTDNGDPQQPQQPSKQQQAPPSAVRVVSPRGSLVYVMWLLAFPSLFFLCLPLLSLGFLLLSPGLVLAGTIQVLSAVLYPSSSSSSPSAKASSRAAAPSTPPYATPNKTPDPSYLRVKQRWSGDSSDSLLSPN